MKRVTKDPLGFERYPTSPNWTGDGVQSGRMTMPISVANYGRRIMAHVKDEICDPTNNGIFSHFEPLYCSHREEQVIYGFHKLTA